MAKKRKDAEISNSINNIINGDEARIMIERDELMNLTKVAKSWEFTCSFCFKKFASAQALGGHQNAHRNERLEEKRLFVRDPIGYRKRAFLRAIKSDGGSAAAGGGVGGSSYVNHHHAATKMVKTASFNGGGPAKARPSAFLPGEFNHYFLQPWGGKDSSVVDIDGGNAKIVAGFVGKKKSSFPPLKELSLVERVAGGDGDGDDRRRHAAEREEGGKGKACIHDFNIGGGYGINLDQKLDLTLKL